MVRDAAADVRIVPGAVVFFRGPREQRQRFVEVLLSSLDEGPLRGVFSVFRCGAAMAWTGIEHLSTPHVAASGRGTHGRSFEARSGSDDDGWRLRVEDMPPVLGVDRASHLRLTCPAGLPHGELTRFAQWCVANLPLWWGTAGPLFRLAKGRTDVAWNAIAALAKRYWCVQLMDLPAMQWDAVRGLHGIGWLTMVGHELAETAGIDLQRLPTPESAMVFARRGSFGTVLAAGPAPLSGDINRGESFAPYLAVDQVLAPLRVGECLQWPGSFARAESRQAWMQRFRNPQAWLDCDIHAE
jgi:hypothetical protein